MDFPLYESLKGSVVPTDDEWRTICSTINNMNTEHATMLYALILHHYIVNDASTSYYPYHPYRYKMMGNGKGVIFTVDNLPTSLQSIIAAYVYRVSR